MKNAVWVVLGIIIAAGLGIAVLLVWTGPPGTGSREQSPSQQRAEPLILDDHSAWPMFRADPRHLGKASTTLPDSLALLWKYRTAGDVRSSPAINNGRVFVGSSDEHVYAIDLGKGLQVWSYKAEDIVVQVVEQLVGDWTIERKSHEYEKESSHRIRFDVPVESNGSTELTYTALIEF